MSRVTVQNRLIVSYTLMQAHVYKTGDILCVMITRIVIGYI